MTLKDRREFLKLCAISASALIGGEVFSSGTANAQMAHPLPSRISLSLQPYVDRLPILKRILPHETRKDRDIYRIRMVECTRQMHSQLPPARCWGYEGQYPGPVIEATKGRIVEVQWENHLPTTHLFKIDPHIHGAMPPAPEVRAVPHLHGSRTRSESDGLPEKWFTSGSSARYEYPNNQQAATLWYHDHALGITRLNVYAGLSGFYLLRDEQERSMDLPFGDYEIPLLIQDRTLDEHGQLVYSPTSEVGQLLPPGTWGPEFFGELPVINGAVYPYLEVEPRAYRLRLLNGANSRFFNLTINLAKRPTDIPSLVTFYQIGSDGGFLPKPAALTKLLLGPAERADIIVDFSGLEGKVATLSNDAAVPFPGWSMLVRQHPALYELMQFRVKEKTSDNKQFSLPREIQFPKLDEKASFTTRDFVLSEWLDEQGQTKGIRINNKNYDDPVTESVKMGSIEKWRFINTTDDAHPMHLHLVQFRILERQGFNTAEFTRGELQLVGTPRPPAANEAGWKDTAVVNPRDVLTILVHFEGYSGRYVYHCHMLEHEDNDMMRPYVVME